MHAHLHSLVHTHTQAPIFAILLVFSLAIIALSNFNGLFKSLINALIEPLAFSKGGSLLKFSLIWICAESPTKVHNKLLRSIGCKVKSTHWDVNAVCLLASYSWTEDPLSNDSYTLASKYWWLVSNYLSSFLGSFKTHLLRIIGFILNCKRYQKTLLFQALIIHCNLAMLRSRGKKLKKLT